MASPDVRVLLDPDPASPPRPAPAVLSGLAAGAFRALSRVRGRRGLHPSGVVLGGTLAVPPSAATPAAWRSLDGAPVVVRASRGAGLPEALPDALGVALRVGAQDLLLLSAAAAAPLLQHVLVPARRFLGAPLSSIAPYRVGDRTLLVTGRLAAPGPHRGAPTIGELARLAGGGLTLHLNLTTLAGHSSPLGTVVLEAVLPDREARDIRFNPWRSGAGLVPVGLLHDVRGPAYAGSRDGAPAGSARP